MVMSLSIKLSFFVCFKEQNDFQKLYLAPKTIKVCPLKTSGLAEIAYSFPFYSVNDHLPANNASLYREV